MGHVRRRHSSDLSAALALVAAFAIAVACDLNPQPEVPGAAGKNASGGARGDAAGLGGVTSSGGKNGIGGGQPGGAGGSGAMGSGVPCTPDCASGQVCYSGSCVADPCASNSCAADQACKPNADFSASNCTGSCAGVTCAPGEACVDGQCVQTACTNGCAPGEVCQAADDGGYACGADRCSGDAGVSCASGQICDPTSGGCVSDPCNGVKCPSAQNCTLGECQWSLDGGADAAID